MRLKYKAGRLWRDTEAKNVFLKSRNLSRLSYHWGQGHQQQGFCSFTGFLDRQSIPEAWLVSGSGEQANAASSKKGAFTRTKR